MGSVGLAAAAAAGKLLGMRVLEFSSAIELEVLEAGSRNLFQQALLLILMPPKFWEWIVSIGEVMSLLGSATRPSTYHLACGPFSDSPHIAMKTEHSHKKMKKKGPFYASGRTLYVICRGQCKQENISILKWLFKNHFLKIWRQRFGTLKGRKAIHMKMDKQIFGKQVFAACRDNGTQSGSDL